MIRGRHIISFVVPTTLVLVWEYAVIAGLFPPSHAARPSAILARLGYLMVDGPLWHHSLWSMGRVLVGVSLGVVAGIGSSITLARSRLADRMLSPMTQLLAGLPVVIWIPVWVMVFGTGEAFKVSMVAVATFFLVHTQTLQAIRLVQRDFTELADMYEKSHWERVVHVLLPSATPAVFAAARTSLTFGWVVLFFVEYASARQGSEGLGWFIADARSIGRIEDEFAGLLLLGTVAYLIDRCVGGLQKARLVWQDAQP